MVIQLGLFLAISEGNRLLTTCFSLWYADTIALDYWHLAYHVLHPESPSSAPLPFIRPVNGRLCRLANCRELPRQSIISFHAFSSAFNRGQTRLPNSILGYILMASESLTM